MSNRPDWCPEDVWEVAFEIYDPAAWHIARAILAERERCAKVAEDTTKAPYMRTSKDLWVQEIGGHIATLQGTREMSKDIPGDVWVAAETALRQANIKAHMLGEPTDPLECISRAILAERERCAIIAEMHDHRGDTSRAIRDPQV